MTDIVTIGDATLYHGNCLEILPTLDKVDHVITDPPYDETTHAGARTGSGDKVLVNFDSQSGSDTAQQFESLVNMSNRWVIATIDFRHVRVLQDNPWFVRLGVWVKPNGMPQYSGDRPSMGWESVAICHREGKKRWNGGGSHAVWTVPKVSGNHPTGKPLRLIEKWVSLFSDSGDLILDPFMGSGTTGVACANLGRKFIGIEIERKYFDIACERIEAAYAQGRLFT